MVRILNLYIIRQNIAIIASLALFSIRTYLFIFHHRLSQESLESDNLVKEMIIILIIWLGIHLFLIIFSPNLFFLIIVYLINSINFCLSIWNFYKLYKGKNLPELNCLFISIEFTFYLSIHVLPQVLIYTILEPTVYGSFVTTLIAEIIGSLFFIVILIGFKTKAGYYRNQ